MLVNEVRSHIIPSGDSGYGPGSSAAEIETEMERQLQVVVWCAERMGNVVPASTQPSEPKVHIHQELRLRLLDYNNSPCAGCPTAKSISYMCQAFKVLRSWCYSRLPHNPYPFGTSREMGSSKIWCGNDTNHEQGKALRECEIFRPFKLM